ncbi:MAG TPA: hypothetical protein DCY27_10410 [Desulfobacterales bacterium]|nr:hypothetical protein [Desulfobacterales bacterium]
MEYRQVEGVDAYGFPADLVGHPLLLWMGEDYVRYVIEELLQGLRKQDPGTEMLVIQCDEKPQFETWVDKKTETVRGVEVEFKLQVLLQGSSGQYWRLRGNGRFRVDGLDHPGQWQGNTAFDILSSEEVELQT